MDNTLPLVKNLILLDSEGKRIAVKYYSQDWPTLTAQSAFEKSLWNKTTRTNARQEAEIIMVDNYVMVYKYLGDLMFYVTGSQEENELILYSVLQAFYESVSLLLRQQVEKRTVLENLDQVMLAMDEIVDGGIVLETEPQTVASRVSMRGAEGEMPITEQADTEQAGHVQKVEVNKRRSPFAPAWMELLLGLPLGSKLPGYLFRKA